MLIQILHDADVWRDFRHVFQYYDTAGFRSGLWWRSPCDGQRSRESWCGLGQRRFNQAATLLIPNFRHIPETVCLLHAVTAGCRRLSQSQSVPAPIRAGFQQLTGATHGAGYSGHPTVGPEEAKRIREKHPETRRRYCRCPVLEWCGQSVWEKLRIGSQSFAWHLGSTHCNKWMLLVDCMMTCRCSCSHGGGVGGGGALARWKIGLFSAAAACKDSRPCAA